jgi:hypothetical protein
LRELAAKRGRGAFRGRAGIAYRGRPWRGGAAAGDGQAGRQEGGVPAGGFTGPAASIEQIEKQGKKI